MGMTKRLIHIANHGNHFSSTSLSNCHHEFSQPLGTFHSFHKRSTPSLDLYVTTNGKKKRKYTYINVIYDYHYYYHHYYLVFTSKTTASAPPASFLLIIELAIKG